MESRASHAHTAAAQQLKKSSVLWCRRSVPLKDGGHGRCGRRGQLRKCRGQPRRREESVDGADEVLYSIRLDSDVVEASIEALLYLRLASVAGSAPP